MKKMWEGLNGNRALIISVITIIISLFVASIALANHISSIVKEAQLKKEQTIIMASDMIADQIDIHRYSYSPHPYYDSKIQELISIINKNQEDIKKNQQEIIALIKEGR
uniref:Uncharacterized protein n=1 Tax=viral metagenome TaxID=1070528 RepID=A0A6M3KC07_9ZZZZ